VTELDEDVYEILRESLIAEIERETTPQ